MIISCLVRNNWHIDVIAAVHLMKIYINQMINDQYSY